ncbi:MAG: DUF4388 domain-containing protein, partial [Myxococcales bacterium]|nr:DUF4388 domain-containing protein [Myxococcales bacterium]
MTKPPGVISGRLADRPVADLLESLHESRRSGVARFRTALGTATVWFRDGELIDADMGRFHQEAAVLRLLKIQDGEYEVELTPVNRRRAVKAATAQLLAEGRQRVARPGSPRPTRRRATLPESDMEKAAQLARAATPVPPLSAPTRTPTPARPVTPARSITPARPVTPARSITPAQPVTSARSITPARPVTPARSITPARPVTPTRAPTPASARPRKPTDTDAHTTVAQRPAGLPLDDIDVEEHPTIRARIPSGADLSELARLAGRLDPPVITRSSGEPLTRSDRAPSNENQPIRARRATSTENPVRSPSNEDQPIRARRATSADHPVRSRRASSGAHPVRSPGIPDQPMPARGSGPSRGARRRGAASWSPTAGGDGNAVPESESELEPEPEPARPTGRTQFMFGPGAPARAPRFGSAPAEEEEPDVDRTLMRPGPVPPPPGSTPTAPRPR